MGREPMSDAILLVLELSAFLAILLAVHGAFHGLRWLVKR